MPGHDLASLPQWRDSVSRVNDNELAALELPITSNERSNSSLCSCTATITALERRVEELRLQGAETQKLLQDQNDETRRMLQELRELVLRKSGPQMRNAVNSKWNVLSDTMLRDVSERKDSRVSAVLAMAMNMNKRAFRGRAMGVVFPKIAVDPRKQETKLEPYTLRHDSVQRQIWDVFIVLMILFDIVVTPFSLGFHVDFSGLDAFNAFVTVTFALDFVIGMFSSYLTERGAIASGPRNTIPNYLFSFGALADFLSWFPVEYFVKERSSEFLGIVKIIRLSKIQRFAVGRHSARKAGLFRLTKLFGTVFITSHCLACYWNWVAEEWRSNETGYMQQPLRDRTEKVSVAVFMLIGNLIQASVFGSVAVLISSFDEEEVAYSRKLISTYERCKFLGIPEPLARRILGYYENLYRETRSVNPDADAFINELSPALICEVKFQLYLDMIRQIPFFSSTRISPAVIEMLILHLRTVIYMQDDVLIRKGEFGNWMGFIGSKGSVGVLSSSSEVTKVMYVLRKGDYFGEMALVQSVRRTITAVALSWVQIHVLGRNDLEIVKQQYPDQAAILEEEIFKYMKSKVKGGISDSRLNVPTEDDLFYQPEMFPLQERSDRSERGLHGSVCRPSTPPQDNPPTEDRMRRLEDRVELLQEHAQTTQSMIKELTTLVQNLQRLWDMAVMVLILVDVILTPLALGFDLSFFGLQYYNIFVMVFFAVDFFLNMFTSFMTERGVLISGPRNTVPHYLLSIWALSDLLSWFPFEFIVSTGSGRFLGVAKVIRLAKVSQLARRMQSAKKAGFFRLMRLVGTVFITSHCLACYWHWIAEDWRGNEIGFLERTLWQKYARCWSLVIGCLNASPPSMFSTLEEISVAAFMLIGNLLQASVFGSVAVLISSFDEEEVAYNRKLINTWERCKFLGIPEPLSRRIMGFYENLYRETRSVSPDADAFINELSPALVCEIKFHLFLDMIKQIPFFSSTHISPVVIEMLILHLRTVIYMQDDVLIRKGEFGDWMGFIGSKGSVGVLDPASDERKFIRILRKGDYFGEMALLQNIRRSTTAVALSWVQIHVLSRSDLDDVKAQYPDQATILEAEIQAYMRAKVQYK
ncbi:hypothetical protein P43SY_000980 [Pythium insidiosum]|uniref:Cyclic nucleotide-binding domain-containing protein n=1 Tax=Pythium insidiosum TaxID=114742 RepID=A0AAD5LXJ4_PYTIN|nr:hypothetical protein P43SY_000980 [Pythium insidiosum]